MTTLVQLKVTLCPDHHMLKTKNARSLQEPLSASLTVTLFPDHFVEMVQISFSKVRNMHFFHLFQ